MTVSATAPVMHPARTAVEGLFTGGKAILNSTDGATRVAELVLGVFAAIGHFFKTLPESLVRLGDGLATFLDLASIVSIVKRCKDWFVSDEGKMMWQKAWHQIAATACLTGAHIINFVKFLSTTLKAFSLGKILAPLSIVGNSLMVGFGVFDLIGNSIRHREITKEMPKALAKLAAWEQKANGAPNQVEWQTLVTDKVDLWKQRVEKYTKTNDPKLESATKMLSQWNAGVACKDDASVKAFCGKKVEQLKVVVDNLKTERTKKIVCIASNVALVALMLISVALAFFNPAALIVAGLAAAILYSGIDVTEFFTDTFMNKKTVPQIAA